MAIEKSQIKFAKSENTGELIGFVSRHSKTKKLRGVREDSRFGKKICVLAEDLKGKVEANILYNVELKSMHQNNGYVVVSATPVRFKATVETIVVTKSVYQVIVSFGNKRIYFDPIDGRSGSSKTKDGVLNVLINRADIENLDAVIDEFKKQVDDVLRVMQKDGYYVGKIR